MKDVKAMASKVWVFVLFGVAFFCLFARFQPFSDSRSYGGDDLEVVRDIQDKPAIWDKFDPFRMTGNQGGNTYYTPITDVIFSTVYKLSDGKRSGFYYFNLTMHFINGCLLYLLFVPFIRVRFLAFLSCLLFIFHPSNLSTLNWITGCLSHVLTVFFVLSSLYLLRLYDSHKGKIFYALSLTACAMLYLAKPAGYFFPLALLAYLFALKGSNINRRLYVPYGVLLLPVLCIQILKFSYGQIDRVWGGVSLGVHTLLRELDLLSWMIVPHTIELHWRGVLMIGIYCATFVILLESIRRNRWILLFGILWMWTSLFLMSISNFRPPLEVVRYHYIPLVGFAVILMVLLDDLLNTIWQRSISNTKRSM